MLGLGLGHKEGAQAQSWLGSRTQTQTQTRILGRRQLVPRLSLTSPLLDCLAVILCIRLTERTPRLPRDRAAQSLQKSGIPHSPHSGRQHAAASWQRDPDAARTLGHAPCPKKRSEMDGVTPQGAQEQVQGSAGSLSQRTSRRRALHIGSHPEVCAVWFAKLALSRFCDSRTHQQPAERSAHRWTTTTQ